jgi:hypothetical protein
MTPLASMSHANPAELNIAVIFFGMIGLITAALCLSDIFQH